MAMCNRTSFTVGRFPPQVGLEPGTSRSESQRLIYWGTGGSIRKGNKCRVDEKMTNQPDCEIKVSPKMILHLRTGRHLQKESDY